MKTLLTILVLVITTTVAFSQAPNAYASQHKNFSLVYSQDEDALVYKDTLNVRGQDIIIESLPYFEKLKIPVYLDGSLSGNYTFKKHPTLLLPEYFSVVIHDNATGYDFDLKNSEAYTFEAQKDNSERFVLVIDKQRNVLTALR